MKKIIYFTLLIILLNLISTPTTEAVMRADFPNSSSLQPMPKDVQANFSGNINSTSSVKTSYEYISELPTAEKKSETPTETNQNNSQNVPTEKNQPLIWYWLISLVVISLILFKLYPSRNK